MFATTFATAVGLAMDAVAVAIASGLSVKVLRLRDALKMAAFFGVFQGLMPLGGYLLGTVFAIIWWSAFPRIRGPIKWGILALFLLPLIGLSALEVRDSGAPIGTLRLGRVRLPLTCSNAPKKKARSFLIGPPMVPPDCSR